LRVSFPLSQVKHWPFLDWRRRPLVLMRGPIPGVKCPPG